MTSRVLCWFSCGASSAVAARLAVRKYGSLCEVVYCDTSASEHPDNLRFLLDVERWLGVPILRLRSDKYVDIWDVFEKTGYLVGPSGARCTTELKKAVRHRYQRPDDVHIFGLTYEERHRARRMENHNPELRLEWVLIDACITKEDCLRSLEGAGLVLPEMYRLGYRNNNCIGCVKGGAGYWNKIRRDFPQVFQRMAAQERRMGVSVLRRHGSSLFLDQLDPSAGRNEPDEDLSCGPQCAPGLPGLGPKL